MKKLLFILRHPLLAIEMWNDFVDIKIFGYRLSEEEKEDFKRQTPMW